MYQMYATRVYGIYMDMGTGRYQGRNGGHTPRKGIENQVRVVKGMVTELNWG